MTVKLMSTVLSLFSFSTRLPH